MALQENTNNNDFENKLKEKKESLSPLIKLSFKEVIESNPEIRNIAYLYLTEMDLYEVKKGDTETTLYEEKINFISNKMKILYLFLERYLSFKLGVSEGNFDRKVKKLLGYDKKQAKKFRTQIYNMVTGRGKEYKENLAKFYITIEDLCEQYINDLDIFIKPYQNKEMMDSFIKLVWSQGNKIKEDFIDYYANIKTNMQDYSEDWESYLTEKEKVADILDDVITKGKEFFTNVIACLENQDTGSLLEQSNILLEFLLEFDKNVKLNIFNKLGQVILLKDGIYSKSTDQAIYNAMFLLNSYPEYIDKSIFSEGVYEEIKMGKYIALKESFIELLGAIVDRIINAINRLEELGENKEDIIPELKKVTIEEFLSDIDVKILFEVLEDVEAHVKDLDPRMRYEKLSNMIMSIKYNEEPEKNKLINIIRCKITKLLNEEIKGLETFIGELVDVTEVDDAIHRSLAEYGEKHTLEAIKEFDADLTNVINDRINKVKRKKIEYLIEDYLKHIISYEIDLGKEFPYYFLGYNADRSLEEYLEVLTIREIDELTTLAEEKYNQLEGSDSRNEIFGKSFDLMFNSKAPKIKPFEELRKTVQLTQKIKKRNKLPFDIEK